MAEYSINKYGFNNNTYLLEDNRLSDSDINKLSTVSGNAAAVTLIDSTSGSPTTTNLSELIINKLTQAQYNALSSPDSNQLYLITDDTIYATKTYVDNLIANIDALPSQSGNSGKYLTTNGTTASWATINALPAQSGNSGKFLTTNGTTASWTTKPSYTYSEVGAAASSHNHSASDITSGTLAIARGGTGGTSAQDATWNLLHVADPGNLNNAKRMGNFKISNTTTNTPVANMWGGYLEYCR